jgi:imidazolonepropionase-like amidohydrolase
MLPYEPFDGTTVTVRELEFMHEAGMPTLDALQAATVRAAELLGLADEIGTVEPGKVADLIAVGGNPIADLSSLRDLRAVVARGRVVVPPR